MSESIGDKPNWRLSDGVVAFLEILRAVPDHRRREEQRFELATGCSRRPGHGCRRQSNRQLHEFIRGHRRRLNEALNLSLRYAPLYSSLRLILQGIDPTALEGAFRCHAPSIEARRHCPRAPTAIAFDGKSLRGGGTPALAQTTTRAWFAGAASQSYDTTCRGAHPGPGAAIQCFFDGGSLMMSSISRSLFPCT